MRAGIQVALSRLQEKISASHGEVHLFVSAAYGADLLSIEVAEQLQIPVHIVLPKPVAVDKSGSICLREGFAADFFESDGTFRDNDWQSALRAIHKAESGADGWSYRLVNGTQVDPECYYDAGIQVMECADVLIAVWDGNAARGLGGTAEMVEQAGKMQMPLMLCRPDSGFIEELRMEKLSIENDEGQKIMLQLKLDPALDSQQQFAAMDHQATDHSKRFRNAVVKAIWLHALATITAAVAALLHGTSLAAAQIVAGLALFEWILVAIAWTKMRALSRGQTHDRWMQLRFAVELMRSMVGSIRLNDPLNPPVTRHKKEWRRFAISAGLAIAKNESKLTTWQDERNSYVAKRLDDANTGQIHHFIQKQKEASPVFDRLTHVQKLASACAVIFVLGAFLYKGSLAVHGKITGTSLHVPDGVANFLVEFFFKFLPIALPLIAGVAAALRSAKDSGRRKFRYRELADRLSAAREQLLSLKTES